MGQVRCFLDINNFLRKPALLAENSAPSDYINITIHSPIRTIQMITGNAIFNNTR